IASAHGARLAGAESRCANKKRKRSARSAESVPELEGASIALRRRRSFPFEAIWAVPYSASRGTAYSQHRAKSCVRALGRYVLARERSPTPHPQSPNVLETFRCWPRRGEWSMG